MSEVSDPATPIKIAALRPDTDGHTLVVKLSIFCNAIGISYESSVDPA